MAIIERPVTGEAERRLVRFVGGLHMDAVEHVDRHAFRLGGLLHLVGQPQRCDGGICHHQCAGDPQAL
jgi:hypothetical protein